MTELLLQVIAASRSMEWKRLCDMSPYKHKRNERHAATRDASRTPVPVCDKWPDTGWWLSTNSMKRHNRRCENYRKTRGYPCRKDEGSPCGKCGG